MASPKNLTSPDKDIPLVHRRLRFLLVEDDLCLETSVCRLLKRFAPDAQILWTTTGEDALEKLQSETFDLIIVDYTLAGPTNGLLVWDFCQKKCPEVPFVLMSGLPVETFLMMTEGRDLRPRFLSKPFHSNEFLAIVRESLHVGVPNLK